MSERTLIVSATNLLVRGFAVVPTDRRTKSGAPANGLFAAARAIVRALSFKQPARAVAVIDPTPKPTWPAILAEQLPRLGPLCRALGLGVVETDDELNVCASYAAAALGAGDDVIIAAVDKRYGQLVSEACWWFDANKDVRYTSEIIVKRFGVEPRLLAQWLALVGDEDQVPGIKGVGAKGATDFLLAHGGVREALAQPALDGRVAKALKAEPQLDEKLAFATLRTDRPLPTPLGALAFAPPAAAALNAVFDDLAFAELLVATETALPVERCDTAAQLLAALAGFDASLPVALAPLIDEPSPGVTTLAGLALCQRARVVYLGGGLLSSLGPWLVDPTVKKLAHDVVPLLVALERVGLSLQGLSSDTACLSHLTQPSGWAPHELAVTARHVLGQALLSDDDVLGVGRARKTWATVSPDRAADAAGQRAQATFAIAEALGPSVEPRLLAEYLELSFTLARMELTGLAIDRAALKTAEASFAELETSLGAEIEKLAGHPFNVNSSKQLGEVLFEELKLPVVHHTRTGFSTANEALERISDAHPIVPLVIRWRGLRRLRDSWLHSLERAIASDGRVHSRFHLARSFAGDIINSNPDLGRVPGRTPEMAMVRRAFVAPPGKLLMSVDFNQLGLYVLANLSKDPALAGPLAARADMHRLTAAAILRKPADALTHEERQLGKVVNFATFAGQGASALAMQLGVSAAQAKEYLARFDEHYALVRAFQDEQLEQVRERGFVTTIAGRRWPIGGLESLDSQLKSYAERLARRATHEGSVADVSRRALLEADRALRREGLKTVPLLQILDEVLFEVPANELERAAKVCATAMRGAFPVDVPFVVGIEAGPTWADLSPLAASG